MIAVNKLIQIAYQSLNMTGLGESTDGDMAVAALDELNALISGLNEQGFLSLSQKFTDIPPGREFTFRVKAEGEETPGNIIDLKPPVAITGVGRKVGERFIPLHPMDRQQIDRSNRLTMPHAFNYGRCYEQVPNETDHGFETRELGILVLDGRSPTPLRVYYNAPLEYYQLDSTIWLPEAYNELLLSGLKFRLAKRFDLAADKKADCETDFTAAKKLIKRNAASQRMIRLDGPATSYNDAFYDAFCPASW